MTQEATQPLAPEAAPEAVASPNIRETEEQRNERLLE